MTVTLRERIRAYWRAGGEHPGTPEWFDPPTWLKWVGTAIVALTGAIASLPVAVGVLLTAPHLPGWATVIQSLALVGVSMALAHYLGGPLADHVLGVPMEREP